MVLAARNPDENLDKPTFIPPEQLYITSRKTLISGKDIKPKIKYQNIENITASVDKKIGNIYISKQTSTDIKDAISLEYMTDNNGYWLNIPQISPNKKHALIMMIGNKLINTKLIKSKQAGTLHLPLNIKDNDISSYNNLIIASIPSPFASLDLKENKDIISTSLIRFTNKVNLIME
ncbi:hypothetical protein KO561_19250 [Radiobacillus kanasensis]|uniref:hypothetical protein n=1 Tax=Radiobacillus kanasensis TaxID=2844358 RepID=UPI001E610633|nr:hypothetical protein [Radiobacillus kanasensis]UFT99282.1 hypothetical protein KO561_19250 [Radiobacillus kanasensis]